MEELFKDSRFIAIAGVVFGIISALRFFGGTSESEFDVELKRLKVEIDMTQTALLDVLIAQNKQQHDMILNLFDRLNVELEDSE